MSLWHPVDQPYVAPSFKRVLIRDIPVRLLHFVTSGSINVAFIIALGFRREHPLFVYHAWFGMLAGWGIVLVRGFDAAAGTLRLPFLAQPICLVEDDEWGRR